MSRISLEAFIESYGKALSSGEVEVIADSWELPSLVLSDKGTTVVNTKEDVMAFFEKAGASYKAQGRTSTIGEIIGRENLTKNLVAVDVRWPSFDDQGRAKAVEMSHYVLRVGEDGKPRIQVALTRDVGR